MKRDWDLIRKLLSDIEEDNNLLEGLPKEPNFDELEFTDYQIQFEKYIKEEGIYCGHLILLLDGGYIQGLSITPLSNGLHSIGLMRPSLTMEGHDLLETIRTDTIWNKIKKISKDKGIELTFDTIKRFSILAIDSL